MSWDMVELGKIGKISTGTTPSKKIDRYYSGGDISFIKPNNFNQTTISFLEGSDEYLTVEGSSKGRIAPKNSVLITCIGTIGNVGIASKDLCFNQQINAVVPDEYIATSRFLAYAIIYRKRQLQAIANAPVVPIINKSQFSTFKIPLPPLETQKRIVELLDRAQALIDKRKEQIGLMDQLIQSLFYAMFGDPVTNPMGWPCKELGGLSELKSGATKGRKLEGKETTKVPYMRVANVQDGHLNLEDIAGIEVLPTDVPKYLLQKNDLLLTEGGDPDKLGRGAIWKGEIDNCIHQNHIFRVRLSPNLMTPEYASRLIGSQRGKRYFLKSAKQTTGIASINMTQLKKCPMLIPPIDLQNTFADRVQQIETQKEAMLTSLRELEDNFNALMQRAFKGEI